MTFEEEILFDRLQAEMASLHEVIQTIHAQAEELDNYAPDAAEIAVETAEEALEHYEEATEVADECRERLVEFLEQAEVAASLYDRAQDNPNLAKDAEKARVRAEKHRAKIDRALEKYSSRIEKTKIAIEKATTRLNVAQIKAKTREERDRNKKVRINFTLPETMKDEWKDLSDELGLSISEMIRDAMGEFKESIKSLDGLDTDLSKMGTKLGKLGSKLGQVGNKIGDYVNEQVRLNIHPSEPATPASPSTSFSPKTPIIPNTPIVPNKSAGGGHSGMSVQDKERLRKRIKGLIKLQNSLPIDKLAQALGKTPEDAENIIYELVAEGIEGKLDSGVFKYDKKQEDAVIETIYKLIDRM